MADKYREGAQGIQRWKETVVRARGRRGPRKVASVVPHMKDRRLLVGNEDNAMNTKPFWS